MSPLPPRYRLIPDSTTRTIQVEGDEITVSKCSICWLVREVYEVTASGIPVCRQCWRSEACLGCNVEISDECARTSGLCESCAESNDDADSAALERSPR